MLSEEMAERRGVAWADPMDQGEDYEDGDGWRCWYGNSPTGDYWHHQEPQEAAPPVLATRVQQLSEMVRGMQRHFAEFVRGAGNAAGQGWQETEWQQQALTETPRVPKRDSTSTSTLAAPLTVRGSIDRSRTPPNHAGQQDQEQHFPEDLAGESAS